MDEAALLGVAKSVLQQLDSPSWNELLLLGKFYKDLKSIQQTIQTITYFFHDAEQRASMDHVVKGWLAKLREVLYDANDLFDVIAARALRKKVMSGNTFTKEVRLFFSKSNQLGSVVRTAHDVKDIKERLHDISKDMIRFNFWSERIEENTVRAPDRRETHSFVRAEDVIGRDQEREEIIKLLLPEDHRGKESPQQDISVISITGLGGLGKTTLAQLVFNDERVQEGFDLRLWACVNYLSDLKQVLIEILANVRNRFNLQDTDLQQLQGEFIKSIGGKKYLLVLDDVCDEDAFNWYALKLLLEYGKSGSMVLATVPNRVVAGRLDSTVYQLNGLSEESAWSLFEKKAFPEVGHCNYSELVPIGKQIVRETGYVPLAIVAIGYMLHCEKKEKKTWLSILDNIKVNINPQLKPSYNHLPRQLKRCFAYCSLFPKDYTFDKDELIRLWLAQGFLEPSDEEHLDIGKVGDKYFSSLFEQNILGVEFYARNNRLGRKARIHQFLHALATEVVGGECERLIEDDLKDMDINNTLRHVSIHCDPNLFFEHFSSPSLSKTLRTLLFHNRKQFKTDFLNSFLASCRALHKLQLSHLNLNSLPDLFGELIHLRYLDLSYNWNVKALPNSICKLYHLQTLKLEGCVSLEELPSKFGKLVSLRHLLLDKCNSLASLPSGLAALSSLVTLDRLIVHHRDGGLRYLNNLNNLGGALTVEIPVEGWPNCMTDARDSNMSRKHALNWMSICWVKSKADSAHGITKDEAREVLNALKPHNSLEYMNIDGYVGDGLSSWVFLLPNVKQLFLTNCTSEYLDDEVGSDTCLRLETLKMNSLTNLKGWWKGKLEVSCLLHV